MLVPETIVSVIVRVPVIMISVVVVPEERAPWMPVCRIIAPVPRRVPYRIAGKVYESHKRPGGYFERGGPDYSYINPASGSSKITRIRCFGVIIIIDRFDDIILSI
jgi:hypothetical protein